MELTPFSVLNSLFNEKLKDERPYVTDGKSFIKIMQHGLSYAKNNASKKLIKNYLSWPYALQVAIMHGKSKMRKPIAPANIQTPFVIIEPNRLISDDQGQFHSMYFERLSEVLGEGQVTWITKKKDARYPTTIALNTLPHSYPAPDTIELDYLKLILRTLKKIQASALYSALEKEHIQSAFHIYFDDFRFYYNLFKGSNFKCLFFICHYQTEGLIAALQALNIRSVEAQHGLIAENDLYYAYAQHFEKGVHNADFPDQILVYGSYWKSLLLRGCEFSSDKIIVAGDYIWRKPNAVVHAPKKNTVLICSQKNMHKDYVGYAEKLRTVQAKHPDWNWIIKLHPLEPNKQFYEPLKSQGFTIIDTERILDDLLLECRIQISIYSTTFYDSLGFEVVNFSLQNYGIHRDYAADMIKERVALPLAIDEDPIERYYQLKEQPSTLLEREEVYGTFNRKAIESITSYAMNQ